ncbi:MAG: hypothetical protein WD894_05985 [Pirellulales bacterium]
MSSFALFQPAIVAFICGLALVWAGLMALRLAHGPEPSRWRLFALFALAQALAQWSLIAGSDSQAALIGHLSHALSAASFLALIECGRQGFERQGKRRLKPWLYAPVIAVAAIILAISGSTNVGPAVRYGLALPGGVLAALAFAQAAQRRHAGWGPALTSAAIALFAMGYAFSIGALQSFAALGLLMGVWRESREAFPLPPLAGAVRRWRSPVCFVLLTIVGALGLTALLERPEAEPTTVVALASSGEGSATDAETVEVLLGAIEIDPRELARQRADEQRYKQGWTILVVLGVVAVVWIGLARFAGAK